MPRAQTTPRHKRPHGIQPSRHRPKRARITHAQTRHVREHFIYVVQTSAMLTRDGEYITSIRSPDTAPISADKVTFKNEGWEGSDRDASELRRFLSLLSQVAKRHRGHAPTALLLAVKTAKGVELTSMTAFARHREHMPYRCNFSGQRVISGAEPDLIDELHKWHYVEWRLHQAEWVGMLPPEGHRRHHGRHR